MTMKLLDIREIESTRSTKKNKKTNKPMFNPYFTEPPIYLTQLLLFFFFFSFLQLFHLKNEKF